MSTLPPDDDPFDDEVAGLDPDDIASPIDWDIEPPLAEQPWSTSNALNYGWQKYTDNIWQMVFGGVGLTVVFVVLYYLGRLIYSLMTSPVHCVPGGGCSGGSGGWWAWPAFWISWIPSLLLLQMAMAVIIRGGLAITRGERFDLRTSFRELQWIDILVLSAIITGVATVGLYLGVLPGLAVLYFTMYALYFQVDRGVLPTDALKASLRLVRDHIPQTSLWYATGGLVAIAGLCFCGIGAALTVPLVLIGTAWTYRKVQGQRTV